MKEYSRIVRDNVWNNVGWYIEICIDIHVWNTIWNTVGNKVVNTIKDDIWDNLLYNHKVFDYNPIQQYRNNL